MKLKLKGNNIQKTLFGNVFSKKVPSSVLFYDYDGTLLHSYTKVEFLNLSALPALPDRTSENLTCDGWNWTLSEIKNQLNTVVGDVNVGAIYHTTDNKTHITCKPTETFPQASICLTPTVANAVTVDWGDGTTDTWTSAIQETKSHTYTGVTNSSVYDIAISCSFGTYRFEEHITGTTTYDEYVYTDIKISNKVTSFDYRCFFRCYFLKTIVISNSVVIFGNSCFDTCYALKSISIPRGVTSLENSFGSCYSLQSISIPNSVTSFNGSCFSFCYSLKSITIPVNSNGFDNITCIGCRCLKYINIPMGTTSLRNYCFYDCNSLKYINIPNTVTSLGQNCFTSCFCLDTIVIPENVTTILQNCFETFTLRVLYCKPTTPPVLGSEATIPSNGMLTIYVPRGTLFAYQSATNWSAHASKMVEYDY